MPKDSNTVYIGRKPTMSYVLAVITVMGITFCLKKYVASNIKGTFF